MDLRSITKIRPIGSAREVEARKLESLIRTANASRQRGQSQPVEDRITPGTENTRVLRCGSSQFNQKLEKMKSTPDLLGNFRTIVPRGEDLRDFFMR